MKPALYPIPVLAVTVLWLIRAEFQNQQRQVYIAKPLSTLLIIAVALLSLLEPAYHPFYTAGILVGLFFSLGGDVALMFPEKPKAFLVGLVLFLIAHIAYTVVFTALGRFSAWDLLSAFLLLAAAAGFYRLIRSGLGVLKGPVIGYMVVISVMVHRALATLVSPLFTLGQALMIASGALLFYLSDMILAANRFWRPWKYHHWSLLLYYTGQLFLALAASFF
ncbi:MAG: lysoplasmalogenase [Anaerolineae bacterium]|nr:lysoplasmalogenase [Anaerolineae bacterium]MDW8069691.1 lysoplasmalogenase [Anaerolineae bacterium]